MLNTEEVFPLTEAPRRLPKKRNKQGKLKRIHHSTIWRWAQRGVRGVHLETRRLGGTLYTSLEALDRFSETLAKIRPDDSTRKPRGTKKRSKPQLERDIERAERDLEAAGI